MLGLYDIIWSLRIENFTHHVKYFTFTSLEKKKVINSWLYYDNWRRFWVSECMSLYCVCIVILLYSAYTCKSTSPEKKAPVLSASTNRGGATACSPCQEWWPLYLGKNVTREVRKWLSVRINVSIQVNLQWNSLILTNCRTEKRAVLEGWMMSWKWTTANDLCPFSKAHTVPYHYYWFDDHDFIKTN